MAYPQEPVEYRNQVGHSRWQPRLKSGAALWVDHEGDRVWLNEVFTHNRAKGYEYTPVLCRTRRGAKRVAFNHEVERARREMHEVWTPAK